MYCPITRFINEVEVRGGVRSTGGVQGDYAQSQRNRGGGKFIHLGELDVIIGYTFQFGGEKGVLISHQGGGGWSIGGYCCQTTLSKLAAF